MQRTLEHNGTPSCHHSFCAFQVVSLIYDPVPMELDKRIGRQSKVLLSLISKELLQNVSTSESNLAFSPVLRMGLVSKLFGRGMEQFYRKVIVDSEGKNNF